MNIFDFIPCFVKELAAKRKIAKMYGTHGRFLTTSISHDVEMGDKIYLAHDVQVRGGGKNWRWFLLL